MRSPWGAGALFGASIVVCMVNLAFASHVGWWAQFHFNFVETASDLAAPRPDFDVRTYLLVLAERFGEMLHLHWFHAALGTVILALALLARGGEQQAGLLLIAVVAAAPIRFLLYPSAELRHYGPILFGLALIVLHVLRSAPQDREPAS